jgi:hypothetical protein
MTAATIAAPRVRSAVRGGRAPRLLRIELRRSPMPLILPVVAALFWFDSYRPSAGQPPLWMLRTFWNMGQGHTIIDFGPLVAGMAAWIASRDARRGMADLVTALAAPTWTRYVVAWAAAAIWAVGGYVVFVAVLFGVYAAQGVAGEPPYWWAGVGAAAVAAFTAFGYAIGVLVRGRYAAPLATVGGLIAMMFSSQTGFSHTSGWALILPTNSNGNYQADTGVFYRYLPDLPIARMLFLAGITVAALGLIGVVASAGGTRIRTGAAIVTVAGVLVSGTAIGLVTTARVTADGMAIPALHDAADDRPIAYTPVCDSGGGVPICVNPVYRRYLPNLVAALTPILSTLDGLPGAPTRAIQVAGAYESRQGFEGQTVTITGTPPVLSIPLDAEGLPGSFGWTNRELADELRLLTMHAFVGAGTVAGTPAQRAVEAALLDAAGVAFADQPDVLKAFGLPTWAGATEPDSADVIAAAHRFAALPAATRTAWLTANLAALRSGATGLGELP